MSFPRYLKYKDSGVEWLGEVPEGWEVVRVRRLFEIQKRIAGEEGYAVLSITQQGIRVKDVESGDGQLSMDYSKYQFVEIGDFAMNQMDLLTGYVDIAKQFGVTSPDYRVFRLMDTGGCLDRYYLYLFQNAYRNKIFFPYGQGSAQLGRWRLPTDEFYAFFLPRPPVVEQKSIADFLDLETAKIDALVAEQENLIALLKEKRQAVISHAVTKGLDPAAPMKDSGIEWLGEVPAHWRILKLTKCVTSIVDYRGKTPTKVDDGVFLLTARNIRNGSIDYEVSQEFVSEDDYEEVMRRGVPEVGDLLLTMEAPLGQVANVNRTDIAIAQRIIKLQGATDTANNYYLKWWIMGIYSQAQLSSLATGSTALGLKASKLGQLDVCLPPSDEQQSVVEFLDTETAKLDDLTTEAQRAIDLLKERRSALISAAVTGKIDVRTAKP